jgi:hypothetical protein
LHKARELGSIEIGLEGTVIAKSSVPVFDSSHPAIMPRSTAGAPSAKCRQALTDLKSIAPLLPMPAKPSIWEYLPQPERDCIPPRDRHDRQVWPGYWIYHNRDDSISFGTELRDYFGWLPAEITRAVPESLINTIASMVCHAHRMGRKEAYNFLKQFVLEQMRVPDIPHYPMNDLRKMTPPPLPPKLDK